MLATPPNRNGARTPAPGRPAHGASASARAEPPPPPTKPLWWERANAWAEKWFWYIILPSLGIILAIGGYVGYCLLSGACR